MANIIRLIIVDTLDTVCPNNDSSYCFSEMPIHHEIPDRMSDFLENLWGPLQRMWAVVKVCREDTDSYSSMEVLAYWTEW